MDTRYNILYFPYGYDVRLCPKNATVSINTAYNLCFASNAIDSCGLIDDRYEGVGEDHRKKHVISRAYWQDYPFRKNTVRIAIKRDPIKRFLSACNYYIRQKYKYDHKLYDQEWYDCNHSPGETVIYLKDNTVSKTVNEMILKLSQNKIKDSHFYSQTWYMGHPDDYDIVYDINDMADLFNLLNEKCQPKTQIPFLRRNTSDSYKSFLNTLQDSDIDLIKEFYDKDYRRGWYTENSI